MSEYMFGVSYTPCSEEEAELRDKICKEEGGYGYTFITEPNGQWKGWYAGPNFGDPFDRDLKNRVLSRVCKTQE